MAAEAARPRRQRGTRAPRDSLVPPAVAGPPRPDDPPPRASRQEPCPAHGDGDDGLDDEPSALHGTYLARRGYGLSPSRLARSILRPGQQRVSRRLTPGNVCVALAGRDVIPICSSAATLAADV